MRSLAVMHCPYAQLGLCVEAAPGSLSDSGKGDGGSDSREQALAREREREDEMLANLQGLGPNIAAKGLQSSLGLANRAPHRGLLFTSVQLRPFRPKKRCAEKGNWPVNRWVRHQRESHTKGTLSGDRLSKLKDKDFVFSALTHLREDGFAQRENEEEGEDEREGLDGGIRDPVTDDEGDPEGDTAAGEGRELDDEDEDEEAFG